MEKFTVLHDDSGFTDITNKVFDFSRDKVALQLKDTSTLYVGFRKPFNFFYCSFVVLNTVANTLTVKYHDIETDQLENVTDLDEETEGFTREGFIKFNRPEIKDTTATAWKQTTVNGKEMYWLVITTDTTHAVETEVNAFNILFANDQDLIQERSNIVSKHVTNQVTKSWVVKHQAARDEIVQLIRNQGKKKFSTNNILEPNRFMDITYFDFLRLDQIRQAAKWLCLSKIFMFELSDATDDKWMQLGESFNTNFDNAFDLFLLSLDADDDGEEDYSENAEDVKRVMLSFT